MYILSHINRLSLWKVYVSLYSHKQDLCMPLLHHYLILSIFLNNKNITFLGNHWNCFNVITLEYSSHFTFQNSFQAIKLKYIIKQTSKTLIFFCYYYSFLSCFFFLSGEFLLAQVFIRCHLRKYKVHYIDLHFRIVSRILTDLGT